MKKILLIVLAFVLGYVINGLFYLSNTGQLSFDPATSEASRWQYGYGDDDLGTPPATKRIWGGGFIFRPMEKAVGMTRSRMNSYTTDTTGTGIR